MTGLAEMRVCEIDLDSMRVARAFVTQIRRLVRNAEGCVVIVFDGDKHMRQVTRRFCPTNGRRRMMDTALDVLKDALRRVNKQTAQMKPRTRLVDTQVHIGVNERSDGLTVRIDLHTPRRTKKSRMKRLADREQILALRRELDGGDAH